MLRALLLGLLVIGIGSSLSNADTLYYGGDPKFPGGYADQNNTTPGRQFNYQVYDDFQVTSPNWLINSFFENVGGDVPSSEAINSASFEIRTGMGANNFGTLIASGTFPATLTFQGTGTQGYSLFDLQLDLPTPIALPSGVYWLTLYPNTNILSGQLYLRDSLLGNGVGLPGADHLAFQSTSGTGPVGLSSDFSFGVVGTVPEPSSALLLTFSGIFLKTRRARKS